jgi:Ala-tRNA(Pro) deacylase
MSIAVTLARYLAEQNVPYDVMQHSHTITALETAQASHVPIDRLAKAVVLKGEDGYMLAVIPASCHIQFGDLRRQLGTDVAMATEDQIEALFRDCEPGAVPALGAAYGLKVIVDEGLAKEPEIYLEGGDHASLIHLSGAAFTKLLVEARQAHFAA